MKKFLLFLGLVTSGCTIFSMEQKHNIPQVSSTESHLSRWEKVKVGAALLGCAYFSTAALYNRILKQKEISKARTA